MLVAVRLLKAVPPCNAGEVAGFSSEMAGHLVQQGAAEYLARPEPQREMKEETVPQPVNPPPPKPAEAQPPAEKAQTAPPRDKMHRHGRGRLGGVTKRAEDEGA